LSTERHNSYFVWILRSGLLLYLLAGLVSAQERYSAGFGYEFLYPQPQLSSRFRNTVAPVFSIGYQRAEKQRFYYDYGDVSFDRINTDEISFDSLKMELRIQSFAGHYEYRLVSLGKIIAVWVSGGVSLNRWKSHRDEFSYSDSLTVHTFEEYERSDWSWGAKAGLSLAIQPLSFMEFGIRGHYHFIIAELWPAEKLSMENVPGLKIVEIEFYLRLSRTF
jgi:hypothetical protein